ncbi:DUF4397 domain-containing protein [Agrococcus sp. SL85]|uniref:DUF4397 domain-containing protein n=1 Tax=Agrococcus sp. SL85 TaxID=2995141 RepID=UPI00226CEE6F|nr:DUF4397 domain-containing protein [Agrococcus sp. SL85]WAC66449.1 DUF4397 domain-containing protein [Agrococcus sp. SL85]
MKRTLTLGTAAVVALTALGAAPAMAAEDDATVSVLHAVPGLTVDVYVNGEEAIPGFEPGTLTDPMPMAAGTIDVQVFAAGEDPASAEPAIEASGIEVPAMANLTLVAHLAEDGTPMLSAFANDTSEIAAGEARLTVRHLAAAPAVDVRANGSAVVEGLTNPDEASLETAAGSVSADVVLAGTEDVVIGPADLDLAEGVNTIVVAWGSAEDGNLALAVQTVDAHSAPSGVPSGLGGAAGDDSAAGIVLAIMGLLGLAAVAAVATRRSAVAAQRR